MPELLGTHKKSQPINHNLPRNIVMTIVITFFWPIDEGDDKIRYIAKTNRFNRLSSVAFGKSV